MKHISYFLYMLLFLIVIQGNIKIYATPKVKIMDNKMKAMNVVNNERINNGIRPLKRYDDFAYPGEKCSNKMRANEGYSHGRSKLTTKELRKLEKILKNEAPDYIDNSKYYLNYSNGQYSNDMKRDVKLGKNVNSIKNKDGYLSAKMNKLSKYIATKSEKNALKSKTSREILNLPLHKMSIQNDAEDTKVNEIDTKIYKNLTLSYNNINKSNNTMNKNSVQYLMEVPKKSQEYFTEFPFEKDNGSYNYGNPSELLEIRPESILRKEQDKQNSLIYTNDQLHRIHRARKEDLMRNSNIPFYYSETDGKHEVKNKPSKELTTNFNDEVNNYLLPISSNVSGRKISSDCQFNNHKTNAHHSNLSNKLHLDLLSCCKNFEQKKVLLDRFYRSIINNEENLTDSEILGNITESIAQLNNHKSSFEVGLPMYENYSSDYLYSLNDSRESFPELINNNSQNNQSKIKDIYKLDQEELAKENELQKLDLEKVKKYNEILQLQLQEQSLKTNHNALRLRNQRTIVAGTESERFTEPPYVITNSDSLGLTDQVLIENVPSCNSSRMMQNNFVELSNINNDDEQDVKSFYYGANPNNNNNNNNPSDAKVKNNNNNNDGGIGLSRNSNNNNAGYCDGNNNNNNNEALTRNNNNNNGCEGLTRNNNNNNAGFNGGNNNNNNNNAGSGGACAASSNNNNNPSSGGCCVGGCNTTCCGNGCNNGCGNCCNGCCNPCSMPRSNNNSNNNGKLMANQGEDDDDDDDDDIINEDNCYKNLVNNKFDNSIVDNEIGKNNNHNLHNTYNEKSDNLHEINGHASYVSDLDINNDLRNEQMSALFPDKNVLKVKDPNIIQNLKKIDTSLLIFPPAFDYGAPLSHGSSSHHHRLKIRNLIKNGSSNIITEVDPIVNLQNITDELKKKLNIIPLNENSSSFKEIVRMKKRFIDNASSFFDNESFENISSNPLSVFLKHNVVNELSKRRDVQNNSLKNSVIDFLEPLISETFGNDNRKKYEDNNLAFTKENDFYQKYDEINADNITSLNNNNIINKTNNYNNNMNAIKDDYLNSSMSINLPQSSSYKFKKSDYNFCNKKRGKLPISMNMQSEIKNNNNNTGQILGRSNSSSLVLRKKISLNGNKINNDKFSIKSINRKTDYNGSELEKLNSEFENTNNGSLTSIASFKYFNNNMLLSTKNDLALEKSFKLSSGIHNEFKGLISTEIGGNANWDNNYGNFYNNSFMSLNQNTINSCLYTTPLYALPRAKPLGSLIKVVGFVFESNNNDVYKSTIGDRNLSYSWPTISKQENSSLMHKTLLSPLFNSEIGFNGSSGSEINKVTTNIVMSINDQNNTTPSALENIHPSLLNNHSNYDSNRSLHFSSEYNIPQQTIQKFNPNYDNKNRSNGSCKNTSDDFDLHFLKNFINVLQQFVDTQSGNSSINNLNTTFNKKTDITGKTKVQIFKKETII